MSERKVKFNLFDVIIILAVAAICFAGYKFLSAKSASGGNVPEISYVVELRRKPASYSDQIKVGDDVKDAVKGGYFGKVTDVKRKNCTEVTESAETGEFVEAEVENRYDYYITITGTPTTFTDSKIMFASRDVRVGNEIYLRSKNFSGEGYVVDMDLGDE